MFYLSDKTEVESIQRDNKNRGQSRCRAEDIEKVQNQETETVLL